MLSIQNFSQLLREEKRKIKIRKEKVKKKKRGEKKVHNKSTELLFDFQSIQRETIFWSIWKYS